MHIRDDRIEKPSALWGFVLYRAPHATKRREMGGQGGGGNNTGSVNLKTKTGVVMKYWVNEGVGRNFRNLFHNKWASLGLVGFNFKFIAQIQIYYLGQDFKIQFTNFGRISSCRQLK